MLKLRKIHSAALIILFMAHLAAQAPLVSKDSDTSALVYLLDHGYVQKDESTGTAQLLSADGLAKAIRDFQVSLCLRNQLFTPPFRPSPAWNRPAS